MPLSTDLICLIVLALWSLPLNHTPAIARVSAAGVKWAMGNRETQPDIPDWVGRADRAQRNHHDNLAMIAAVLLIVNLTQHNNDLTALSSIVLVAARIGHGVFYVAGIGPLRSLAYAVSIAALAVITLQLFG